MFVYKLLKKYYIITIMENSILFGTYKIQDKQHLSDILTYAYSKGITRLDTAQLYRNEKTIKQVIDEHDLHFKISTKISKYENIDYIQKRIDNINNLFGKDLEYLMLHHPTELSFNKLLANECYKLKLHYGVSNANMKYLEFLHSHDIFPKFIQIEFHPFINFTITKQLIDFCKKHNIKIQGHTVLAKGLFLEFVPLKNMSKKYGISVAQLMIKWAIQHGIDICLSSKNKSHIDEWIDPKLKFVFINDVDMAEINGYHVNSKHVFYNNINIYSSIDLPIVVDDYIEKIIETLKDDLVKLDNKEYISDMILHLNSVYKTTIIKAIKEKNVIYNKLLDNFAINCKQDTDIQHRIDKLFGVLKKLRSAHSLQNFKKKKEKSKIKNSCNLGNIFHILNPEAMPVEINELSTFMPFFYYLSTDDIPQTPKQFVKGVFYPDRRMDLCKQGVGHDSINPLCDSILKSDKVEHFLFGNNVAFDSKETCKELANLIKNSKIKTWYLAGNCINAVSIDIISKAFYDNKYSTSLWLKRNPIYTASVHLKNMLNNNTNLLLLDLHNTGLGNNGIIQLFNGLTNSTIKHMYLDANNITNIDPLTKYITHGYSKLESIYLSMNPFEKNSINRFILSLKENKYFKRLCLSSCNLDDSFPFDSINIPNLIMLDLSFYKASNDLGVKFNKFTDLSSDAVIRFINRHPKLEYISFKGSTIDDESLFKINVEKLSIILSSKKRTVATNKHINRYLKHPEMVSYIDSVYRGH